MGFRLRKSINLGGGFKINLSKSGVGYSCGIPGYRVTKTAKGSVRTTYSIPGSGLSYVNEVPAKSKKAPHKKNVAQTNIDDITNIESADISNFQTADVINITSSIEKTIKLNALSNVFLWPAILGFKYPVFFIFIIISLVLKIISRTKGVTKLEYTFVDESKDEFQQKLKPWLQLLESQKIWQITQQGNISKQKINAGAGRNVRRKNLLVLKKLPFYISANVDTLTLFLEKEIIHLLPDKLFIVRNLKVGVIEYSDLNFQVSQIRFVESETVPKDTEISSYTWQYVNKNGTPDKRFQNNRQFPLCEYGELLITSDNGLNIELQCSNPQNLKGFETKTLTKQTSL